MHEEAFFGTCEYGLARKQLSENAAHRPHVNTLGVPSGSKQDLRRTIPHRVDIVGHCICPTSASLLDRPSKTKVGKLHNTVAVDEEITRLTLVSKAIEATLP
jgi:hypothetical protein